MLAVGEQIADVELEYPDGRGVFLRELSDTWLVIQVLRYYG